MEASGEIYFANIPKHPNFKNITGEKYGKLTVLGFAGRIRGLSHWWCECECGSKKSYFLGNLRSGSSTRCKACAAKLFTNKTHGCSATKEYDRYRGIISACTCPSDPRYEHNRETGVRICKRWLASFQNFLDDMGQAPDEKSVLCRKDVSKDYCPENCYWGTRKEAHRKGKRARRITFNGQTKTITEWADDLGLTRERVRQRLAKYPVEVALSTTKGDFPEGVQPGGWKRPPHFDVASFNDGKVHVLCATDYGFSAKMLRGLLTTYCGESGLKINTRTLDSFVMFRIGERSRVE